jgi:hypothetical protein
MRTIEGVDDSHGKRDGQAAFGVRKIMRKQYHIIKSWASHSESQQSLTEFIKSK